MRYIKKPLAILASVALVAISMPAAAQDDENRRRGASALLEEVIVTARKREESMQDAPLSVSALNDDQIDALKIRDLTNLTVGLPNVMLEDIGTSRGVANFSIRGLGVTASIPSIDPTVGVFVDGVYMGLNSGIVFDTFDLASIEVLRGPQGILFGRNVTGGAVLINTKKPSEEFSGKVRAAVDGGGDGGNNTYLMGSVGGPLTENLSAKITAYYNDDEGWFTNEFDGSDFGAIEQTMIRPVLVWTPADNVEVTLRYEYQDIKGDGPASQTFTNGNGVPGTPVNFDKESFRFSINERGFQESEIHFVSAQLDVDVGENGTITNIFGWRDYENTGASDIDAQPISVFHAVFGTNATQVSNELRYHTTFNDRADFTAGLYYFKNELEYDEGRRLLGVLTPTGDPALTQDGGGLYDVDTVALFTSLDYDVSDTVTLSAGLRYTQEEKDARISSLIFNVNSICSVIAGECVADFVDSKSWNNVSPKLGVTIAASDDTTIYGHWTRGFRSGGYNLRNTAGDIVNNGPGPFDEETVDNFEIGWKNNFERGRINGAIFYNKISDLQADVNLPDPASAVVQIIKNTADAEITGIELDGVFSITDNFVVNASVGAINAEYTKVLFDLDGDGEITSNDLNLDLKRAPKLTWSLGLNLDLELGSWGYLTARTSYSYRDKSWFNEANTAPLLEQSIVDAGIDIHSNNDAWVFSIYGKNLTDEVRHGGTTILPTLLGGFFPLGGSFAPLMKGRVVGAEVSYSF